MASGESRTRRLTDPYLSSLSGDAAERVTIMKWARYLGATFGTTGALKALQYYREINWISDSVKQTMTEYVRGLPIEDLDRQEATDPSLTDALSSLEGTHFEEHAKSLEFIAAIADNNIEHSLASLQLTENGSLGISGPEGDLVNRSEDLFSAPGFGDGDSGLDDANERDSQGSQESHSRTENRQECGGNRSKAGPGEGQRADQDRKPGSVEDTQSDSSRAEAPDPTSKSEGERPDSRGPSDARSGPPVDNSTPDSDAEASESSAMEPQSEDRETSVDSTAALSSQPEEGARQLSSESVGSPDKSSVDDEAATRPGREDEVPPDGKRCIALTRDGERCSRPALEEGDYCKQHAP